MPPRDLRLAAQALAIMPGISRSGATIMCGMFLGMARREAALLASVLPVWWLTIRPALAERNE